VKIDDTSGWKNVVVAGDGYVHGIVMHIFDEEGDNPLEVEADFEVTPGSPAIYSGPCACPADAGSTHINAVRNKDGQTIEVTKDQEDKLEEIADEAAREAWDMDQARREGAREDAADARRDSMDKKDVDV